MKKLALVLFVLTLLLTACSQQPVVTIDIPADLEYDKTDLIESIEKHSKARYTLIDNADGSFSLQMKQRQYDKFIKDVAEVNVNSFAEIVEKYDYIKDITYNDDFTEIKMVVDPVKFLENQTNHDLAPLMIYMFNITYQFYSGTPYDQIDFTIDFISADTDEVLETYVFSENF